MSSIPNGIRCTIEYQYEKEIFAILHIIWFIFIFLFKCLSENLLSSRVTFDKPRAACKNECRGRVNPNTIEYFELLNILRRYDVDD